MERRAFLHQGLVGAAVLLGPLIQATSATAATATATSPAHRPTRKKPPAVRLKRPLRYAATVHEVTRRLRIPRGRWHCMICHHSGLNTGNATTYDRAHRRRGMENGLAYHFVIGNGVDSRDGHIEIGQRWLRQINGGHVQSEQLNEVAIGLCLVGNFEQTRPTPRQLAATLELIGCLRELLGPRLRLVSHTEAHPGHTRCPGRYFPMDHLRQFYG